MIDVLLGTFPGTQGAADSALIVAAVNAVPELIAEVRRQAAALRAVEALAEELEGWRKNAANYHENAWEPAVRSEARARAMAYERALTGIRTALATVSQVKAMPRVQQGSRPPLQDAEEGRSMTRREEIAEAAGEELAERLHQQRTLCPNDCGCRYQTDDADAHDCGCDGPCCMDVEWWDGRTNGEVVADALLPLVDRLCAEAAADALEAAIREDRTTVAKLSPVESLTCFLVKAEDLVARAAALRAAHPTTSEETQP